MRKRLLSILVLSTLVASTFVGCEQPSEQPCTLIVHSITGGDVSVMEKDTGDWIEAQVGMSLEPGDCIRCSGSSNAEITFIEGTTIELETGTEIEVASLDYSADTGSATIRLKQTIGSIIFRVTKIIDPASLYEVETPAGVVAVRGSAVQITVAEDGTTWACNLEGDIWAIAQGVELQVPEGRCCVIRPGQPPKLVCDLTISSSGGGSVTIPGEGTFSYDEGTVVDLVAEADEGYQFGSWSGDVGSIASVNATTTTITMTDNLSITANFERISVTYYTLTIAVDGSGSTSPSVGQHSYAAGTVLPIIATPADGYHFVNWTGDVGTIASANAASTTVTMSGNYSITANFEGLEVTFADPNLEAVVRDAIGIPTGPIYSSDLEGLTTLNGNNRGIVNLTGLECATSLTCLELPQNLISNISPLANLTSLTSLDLYDNQISNISPLASLTSLTVINLGHNQISAISPLANLTSLIALNLVSNQISNISPLANLTSLQGLYLWYNQISDISPLAGLTSLIMLSLASNQISDISPLATLTDLVSLDLGSNQISNVSPLAGLTSLTSLGLEHNQISDISPLASLTSLTSLDLGSNQISNISPLATLTSLTGLLLNGNQISDISPLVANAGLSAGDVVFLGENPLSSDSINIYIPQLEARGVTVYY
jgi:Leucine-rich repeat (LRR) protein